MHTSVVNLLTRAEVLPCSTAAMAFARLVPETTRFQVALDEIFPLLSGNGEVSPQVVRILAAYILYALYSPHSLEINPFKDVLLNTFLLERKRATSNSLSGSASDNDQLVWVLWKILKGDGTDIGPFSPSTLASSPLPLKLRATHLYLDFESPATSPHSSPDLSQEIQVPTNKSKASDTLPSSEPPSLLKGPESFSADSQALNLLIISKTRVLTLSESRTLSPLVAKVIFPSPGDSVPVSTIVPSEDIPGIIQSNPGIAVIVLKEILVPSSRATDVLKWEAGHVLVEGIEPNLNSFDVWGRLLRDEELKTPEVGLKQELFPQFIARCSRVLDEWEREERERTWDDDPSSGDGSEKWERGVALFCRFCLSLLKAGVIEFSTKHSEQTSANDMTEITHFALRHSKFEDARTLYSALVGESHENV
ncbi:hypothetical protein DL96DRAFT_1777570 [Flagelloscypha sp. PMI_526]|nr:hypothetical protein DL96DRAFT_1777570 [Flagelloscypha sp. PMI_526]